MRWLKKRKRSRGLRQLEQYMTMALDAADESTLTAILDGKVGALLARLKATGVITQAESVEIGHDWVRRFSRARLPRAYREKDAQRVAELGWFLKAS